MNRSLRILLCVVVGVAVAALIAFLQIRMENRAVQGGAVSSFSRQPFGGDFAGLLDQNGKIQETGAFSGKYQLVFFGFTHCPAICPGELHKISTVMKSLTPAQRAKLAPIFITVDPARDTPGVMKDYLAMFDPAVTGLTGRQEDVNKILGEWKVYASRVDTEGGDYTMDHSTFLYFRDPQGWLVDLFDMKEPVDTIQKAVSGEIKG